MCKVFGEIENDLLTWQCHAWSHPTSSPTNELMLLHKHFVDFCYIICIPNPTMSHSFNHFLFLCFVRCAKKKHKTICPPQWWSYSPCNIWSWLVVCSQLWHHWKLCVLPLLLSDITQNICMSPIRTCILLQIGSQWKRLNKGLLLFYPVEQISRWTTWQSRFNITITNTFLANGRDVIRLPIDGIIVISSLYPPPQITINNHNMEYGSIHANRNQPHPFRLLI